MLRFFYHLYPKTQKKECLLFVCKSFQRAADGGGINIASNWMMISDKRNWNHVIDHYIERGLVFNDSRRPDLIRYYILEMARRENRIKSGVSSEKSKDNTEDLISGSEHRMHVHGLKRNTLKQLKTHGRYCLRQGTCKFYIACSKVGLLDLSDILYEEEGSVGTMIPVASPDIKKGSKNQYHEIELTHTIPGEVLQEKEPVVTVTRTVFVQVIKEAPEYELDLTEVYSLNVKTKSIEKCQVTMTNPSATQPVLRLKENGQILIDDEALAPSFFQLNEKWWAEKDIQEEMHAKAKRTNRYVTLKLRRELQIDTMDWQGPNIGMGVEEFPQGGDYARYLEALGCYRTGIANGYGDVWLNRPQEELNEYIVKKDLEERLIELACMEDSWTGLERMIQE